MLPQFMRGLKLRYGAAIAAMGLATLLGFINPQIIRWAIDSILAGKEMGGPQWLQRFASWLGGRSVLAANLWMVGLLYFAVTAAAGTLNALRGWWASTASEEVARRIRNRLYDHLNALPCAYHDKAEIGDLVQRCTSDVDTVRNFLNSQIVNVASATLMVIIVVPFMLSMSVHLTLVAMAFVPPIFLFSFLFFKRVRAAFKQVDEAEGRMTTVLQENLTGIRVVRAFARSDYEGAKFAVRNAEFRDRNYRMVRLMAIFWPVSDWLCFAQGALVLMVGAMGVANGTISAGTLWAFFSYDMMFVFPLRMVGRNLTEWGKVQVSTTRLNEILSRLREGEEDGQKKDAATPREGDAATVPFPRQGTVPFSGRLEKGTVPLVDRTEQEGQSPFPQKAAEMGTVPLSGQVEFRNVRFSYDGVKQVLDGISFRVEAGQTVALLGPSGSGKSTVVHLLLRLYDWQEGRITVDGRDLREIDRKQLRSQIGTVMQEPFLYSKTLRDNIRLGHATASDEEVVEAAHVAAMHESIQRFEDGYGTLIGERGVTLSGGQRQRVALARAILRHPAILLLDDALSAVDTETESMILSALKGRRGQATTLVIAHRLSTLMAADQIIVIEAGRVVQSGTHQSLLEQEGLYRRLWRIQSDLAADLEEEVATGH